MWNRSEGKGTTGEGTRGRGMRDGGTARTRRGAAVLGWTGATRLPHDRSVGDRANQCIA
jgi:hypothetical protein